MEETLTIPKQDPCISLGRSLAVAGISTLACAGQPNSLWNELFQDRIPSSGSNSAWLEKALPGLERGESVDLYALGIQRLQSIAGEIEFSGVAESNRSALLRIKDVFSLTGQQLADSMGVSRAGLYQWLDNKARMRGKYQTRLDTLNGLAALWSGRIGSSISRTAWLAGKDRARLVKTLASKTPTGLGKARLLIEKMASAKPVVKTGHRSILEITRERNWKKLPDHVRHAERGARIRSAPMESDNV